MATVKFTVNATLSETVATELQVNVPDYASDEFVKQAMQEAASEWALEQTLFQFSDIEKH